jgi:exopolysaccharide biosynthesis protein
MRSGVVSRVRALPGSPAVRRGAIVAGCVILFLIAVAVASRDAIERAYLQHVLVGALDGDVSLGALHHRGDLIVLDGVRVQTPNGTTLVADSVSYRITGDAVDITPLALHVTVPRAAFALSDEPHIVAAAHDLGIAHALIHLRDAGVDFVDATGAKAIEVAGIDGDVRAGGQLAYALSGTLVDDVAPLGASPLTLQTSIVNGRATSTFRASELPLAGIGALLGGNGVTFHGGVAHDVIATDDGHLAATMRIDDVAIAFGGVSVAHVSGPLTIAPDGLGSGGLDATLMPAGVPLALTGEVHDVHDWTLGSRDLGLLAAMIERIGAQPNLRWTNVETTAPGIVYGQYAMTTRDVPHVVQLLAIDPHEPTVHFDTALAGDHIISTGARTTDLGLRTHAVAGVNGDYFDIGRTYEPQGLLIRSGRLLHGPTDHEAVIVDRANHPTFARFRLRGAVVDGDRRYPVTLVNSWPTRDVALITPDYGTTLPAAPGVTFAALKPLGGTKYRVLSLRPMTAPIPVVLGLGFSDFVGEPLPHVGDVLEVTYELDPPATDAYAGIGSGPLLVKDGQWYEDKHAPAPDERDVQWPVVAFGVLDDGTLVFVAVDGRHPERSIGMTRPEFAQLLQRFGVTEAMALDSGGSVTMVARSPGAHAITLHNVPSDNSYERYVSDALLVYSSAPEGTIVTTPRPHVEPSPDPTP